MKLSPQLVGVLLPPSSKAAAAALIGKNAFAATMQDLMVPLSGPAVAAVMQGPAAGRPQVAARIKSVALRQEMPASGAAEHVGTDDVPSQALIVVASNAAAPGPSNEMRHPVAPQPSVPVSSRDKDISESPIAMPEVTNPIEEAVLLRPLPASREPERTADTHAPSRAQHKAGAGTRDPTNPTTAHTPETVLAATISSQCPVPVSVPQPDRPERTFSEKNVQPAIRSMDKTGDSRRGAFISRPIMIPPTAAPNSRSELLQVAQEELPLRKFATVMNSMAPAPAHEMAIPGTLPRSNQDILPGPAGHSKEGHETTALQVDAHISQEAGKTSSAMTKPVLAAEPSIHPALDLSPAEHPPSANAPDLSPSMHLPEVLTETHRAQVNAAQVLQRMDTAAPSDAVQLRADARHLDIGVAAGDLGWVEVRATASSSGRVDAMLHVQTNSSAHMLTAQSKEIATYAREHAVELGQLSVGVGTGDTAQGHSRSSMQDGTGKDDIAPVRRARQSLASNEPHQPAEKVSFISVRA